jgi:hypothetical protein
MTPSPHSYIAETRCPRSQSPPTRPCRAWHGCAIATRGGSGLAQSSHVGLKFGSPHPEIAGPHWLEFGERCVRPRGLDRAAPDQRYRSRCMRSRCWRARTAAPTARCEPVTFAERSQDGRCACVLRNEIGAGQHHEFAAMALWARKRSTREYPDVHHPHALPPTSRHQPRQVVRLPRGGRAIPRLHSD